MEGLRFRIRKVYRDESDEESSDDGDESPAPRDKIDVYDLFSQVESLKKANYNLDCRLIEVEQYSRRESLVFSGIPASIPQKDLEKRVMEIMYHLGFKDLIHDDIVACHRLWSHPNSRSPAPVIVKFLNRKIVEWSLSHSKNLENVKLNLGLDLQMSESICSMNQETFKISKWLEDQGLIFKFYTRNGFIKIVENEGDNPVKIVHPNVLRDRYPGIPTFVR